MCSLDFNKSNEHGRTRRILIIQNSYNQMSLVLCVSQKIRKWFWSRLHLHVKPQTWHLVADGELFSRMDWRSNATAAAAILDLFWQKQRTEKNKQKRLIVILLASFIDLHWLPSQLPVCLLISLVEKQEQKQKSDQELFCVFLCLWKCEQI